MKKITMFLLASFFGLQVVLGFNPTPKKVVATASIFADMAENIAGGHLEIKTIVPVGGDPHTYQPAPSDAKLISSADLILKNGLTFEGWLNELIENSGTGGEVVLITEGIDAITSEKYHNSADPHAWMDASKGLEYIENIKNALVKLDPDNKEVYEFNYGVYRKQLEDLDLYIHTEIQKIPEQHRILITSHDAFQYYGRRYGIQLESVLGISTESEAQTSDIIRLNRVIRENKVPAIFIESTINPKLLEQLAKDNHVVIGGQLYADSIGEKDGPASSYLDMLKYNTDVIVKALNVEMMDEQIEEVADSSVMKIWILMGLLLVPLLALLVHKMR
jgi:ABC-type Zn uptake system ZnuABC Zn-binding protein ZnuA